MVEKKIALRGGKAIHRKMIIHTTRQIRAVFLTACFVAAFNWTAVAQSTPDTDRQQAEIQLRKIEKQLEEKTNALTELSQKEGLAQTKSRALREEIELLTQVKARLEKKSRRLSDERIASDRKVGQLEEQRLFRQEVLARTLTTAYTRKAIAGNSGLPGSGSAGLRRQLYARLVSAAHADQLTEVADSLQTEEKRRTQVTQSHHQVQTAVRSKDKEQAKKEQHLAKSEREAFRYRQQREQELDDIEEIQREALMLAELIDRLTTLPGVQNAVDYDFPGWKGRLYWPLKGTVKSTVGRKINAKYSTETFESGIFVSGLVGEPVTNAADGEVAYAGRRRGLGNVVVVGHGEGYFSIFAHLGEISVITGQVLRAGDQIGTAGESHPRYGAGALFELRHEKEILDPLEWLK